MRTFALKFNNVMQKAVVIIPMYNERENAAARAAREREAREAAESHE